MHSLIPKLKAYIFPIHVTRICRGAFLNCEHLKSVIFPAESQLQIVEENAFPEALINSIKFPPGAIIQKDNNNEKMSEMTKTIMKKMIRAKIKIVNN